MSTIKVNTVTTRSGSTLTLGESGKTIALASGASQTGFGRTGTVDWQTSIKTADFTAVNGQGFFVDTSSGAVTVTLPASPSAGDIVSVSDYAKTAANNNITIARNGSQMDGTTDNLTLTTNGEAVTLVFADSTKGWKPVNSNEITAGPEFVAATGGTETVVSTDFKVHTFTSPGTFQVTSAGNPSGSNKVDYLIVAGGGGGATQHSGGGGAGGFRGSFPSPSCNAGTTPVSVQNYPVTVGGGGARTPTAPNVGTPATPGVDSVWNLITSTGGGGGGAYSNPPGAGTVGAAGGSGGGGGSRAPGSCTSNTTAGGAGNTPPQNSPASPVQGHAGGSGTGHQRGGGGGGGSAAVGGNANPNAGTGGAGLQNNIDGNNYYWAGGGGGGSHCNAGGAGGIGGGGGGGAESSGGPGGTGGGSAKNSGGNGSAAGSSSSIGGDGGDNTGGGGGGSGNNASNAGNGGSGIVILRYKFQ